MADQIVCIYFLAIEVEGKIYKLRFCLRHKIFWSLYIYSKTVQELYTTVYGYMSYLNKRNKMCWLMCMCLNDTWWNWDVSCVRVWGCDRWRIDYNLVRTYYLQRPNLINIAQTRFIAPTKSVSRIHFCASSSVFQTLAFDSI